MGNPIFIGVSRFQGLNDIGKTGKRIESSEFKRTIAINVLASNPP